MGCSNSDKELTQIAEFLASVSVDLPWRVTAFHQDYRILDHANTMVVTLFRVKEIGKKAGLRCVYVGNLPARLGSYENTDRSACRSLLIEWSGYTILETALEDAIGHLPA